MLFLLTTLFLIPFSLSIERILNQTIGTSSSVNQASLSYSNQSFVLTPSYQFIINQDNSFTQRAVSYSETTNFVPLDNDKVIILCGSDFIRIESLTGTSYGNVIYYSTISTMPYTLCRGTLNDNNKLLVTYENGNYSNDLVIYYFYIYNINMTSYSITLSKSFQYTMNCWDCIDGNETNYITCTSMSSFFICSYLSNYELYAGIFSENSTAIENEKYIEDYIYNQKLLKISDNKIMVYYGTSFMTLLSVENNTIVNTTIKPENNSSQGQNCVFVRISDQLLFYVNMNGYTEYAYYSLITNSFSQFSIIKGPSISSLYVVSFGEYLFNVVYAYQGSIYSIIINEPLCYDIHIRAYKDIELTIQFYSLTNSSPNEGTIIVSNILLGSYEIRDSNIVYLTQSTNNNDEIVYYIKESVLYSKYCYISIKICNEACEECDEYSDEKYNTKCLSCNTDHFPLEDDSSICIHKDESIPYYYYELTQFSKCYDTCEYCKSKGNSTNHQCMKCKSDLIVSPNLTQCICDITQYYWSLINDAYVCQDDTHCTDSYPYLIENTKQCVSSCPNDKKLYQNICYEECPEGTKESMNICEEIKITNDVPLNETINIIEDNILDAYNNYSVIHTDNSTIEIIDTSNPEINNLTNVSRINLGECEQILKSYYNIPSEESLMIMKIDIRRQRSFTNQVEYSVYSKNGTKLDLKLCDKVDILISIPVNIPEGNDIKIDQAKEMLEQGYDIYDLADPFYNDICSSYTSNDNTDITLEDRRKEFYQNITFCEDNCSYNGFDIDTLMVNCTSGIKEDVDINKDRFSINTVKDEFKSIIRNSNIRVFKCYHKLLDNFISNKGNWIMLLLIIAEIVLLIVYAVIGLRPIQRIIDDIMIQKSSTLNISPDIVTNVNLLSPIRSTGNSETKPKNTNEEENDKNQVIILRDINETLCKSPTRVKRNSIVTSSTRPITIRADNTISNSVSFNSENQFNSFNHKCSIKNSQIDIKIPRKKIYTNEELSNLEFDKAVVYDKRKFLRTYYNYIEYKQLIIFTFIVKTDFNLLLLKISMFIFSFGMLLAFNTLFYDDDTMSHTYYNKGKYDFIYSLPQTIFSSLICGVISILIEFLSLSQAQIQQIKDEEGKDKSIKLSMSFMRKMKIKVIVYFTLIILLMCLFWYYVTVFCAVYANTQKHLIIDSIVSFFLGTVYPFLICLLPTTLRILSLKKRNKCLFRISKLTEFF